MAAPFWRRPGTIVAVHWICGVLSPVGFGLFAAMVAALWFGSSAEQRQRESLNQSFFLAWSLAAVGVGIVSAWGLMRLGAPGGATSPRGGAAAAFVSGFAALPAIACLVVGVPALFSSGVAWHLGLPEDDGTSGRAYLAVVTTLATMGAGAAAVAHEISARLGTSAHARSRARIVGAAAFAVAATASAWMLTARGRWAAYGLVVTAAIASALTVVWAALVGRREVAKAGTPARARNASGFVPLTEGAPVVYALAAAYAVAVEPDRRLRIFLVAALVVALLGALVNRALRRSGGSQARLAVCGEVYLGIVGGLIAAAPLWTSLMRTWMPDRYWDPASGEGVSLENSAAGALGLILSPPAICLAATGTGLRLGVAKSSPERSPAYRRRAVFARWTTIGVATLVAAMSPALTARQVALAFGVSVVLVLLAGVASSLGFRAAEDEPARTVASSPA